MNDELTTHKLSCYLYKQEYKEFENVILQDKLNEDDYTPLELVDESKAESICGFLRQNKDNPPPWLSRMKDL
ncbi:MAG: hypothetical protein KAR21_23180, partial [Spirochaetales bacterium]|nr:hypothetical protein [Spirochaetales bacterium]